MHWAKKTMLGGAAAGCIISAPILLHNPAQAKPAAQPGTSDTKAWQATAADVTSDLVGEQLQQEPEAAGATNVLCAPQPDQAMPATAFNCGIVYQDGTDAVYAVTIPPGWQAGQQPFASITAISSN